LVVAMTLVVMGSLGLWNGAVALAARPHVFSEAFGGSGSGASELELAAPGFNEAGEENRGGSGVAVNEATGDVYVADTGNHRVDEFSASGLFVRAFGYGVADGTTEALETCTVTCFKGLGGSKAGELETPTFVAIDNSGGESEGDVYVADTSANLVTKYTSEGALVSLWGNNGKGAPEEPNGQLRGSAAEPFGVPECSLGPFCEPPLRGAALGAWRGAPPGGSSIVWAAWRGWRRGERRGWSGARWRRGVDAAGVSGGAWVGDAA